MNKIKTITGRLRRVLEKRPVLFLAVLSPVLNCIIEILGRRSVVSLVVYVATKPHMFIFNSSIILSTFLPALMVKRREFAVLAVSLLWTVCGAVNCGLMAYRASPFTAHDIFMIGFGLRIADVYLARPVVILVLLAVIALVAGIVVAFIKLPKYGERPKLKRALRAVPFIVIIAVLFNVFLDAWFPGAGNLIEAYDNFGFAYCFANSLISSGIDLPENYSEETVSALLASLEPGKPEPERKPNIIFIQLESFFDPAEIIGLNLSENPVPVFTSLKENFPTGRLIVPVFGGGTANTEFEVLTGMDAGHFGMGEYPYDSVLGETGCESAARDLKSLGYTAHALHNHAGTFYLRSIVYSNLGFDSFIPIEYMKNVDYTPTGWAKDEVLLNYITGSLNATSTPDFVFAVTVQCHGKYPKDFDGAPFTAVECDELFYLETGSFEYLLMQLNETDSFIGRLTDELSVIGEDTVVVLYGDHLPALELPAEQLVSGSLYTTEYVIWSNFGLEAENKDLDSSGLSAYVLGLLGIDGGVITRLRQSEAYDGAGMDEALKLLEYDILYGERYMEADGELYAPSELKMGLDEITINKAYAEDGFSYVSGGNFTTFSVIYVNGQRKETEYLNDGLLCTPYVFVEGDTVTVCQTGRDKVVLSSTSEYTYIQ